MNLEKNSVLPQGSLLDSNVAEANIVPKEYK